MKQFEKISIEASKEEIRERIDVLIKEKCFGSVGLVSPVVFYDEVCENKAAAISFIKKNDPGFYSAIAVQYKDYPELEKWEEKVSALKETYLRKKSTFAFDTHTSKTRICPACKSVLSLRFLKQNNCPLCGADMRSATEIKEEASAYKHWQTVAQQAPKVKKSGAKTTWLVKYEYHD